MYLDKILETVTSGTVNVNIHPDSQEEYERIKQFIRETGMGQASPGSCRLVGIERDAVVVAITVYEPLDLSLDNGR